jgi:hypothetical protein
MAKLSFVVALLCFGSPVSAQSADFPRDSTDSASADVINARLSALGDFVFDASPKGSTQPDLTRFGLREVEVAAQGSLDRFLRADMFVKVSDPGAATIDEAYLSTLQAPLDLKLKLGKFRVPIGKQNISHRHNLHTPEYPYVIQRYMGETGTKGTGLQIGRQFNIQALKPELTFSVIDRIGERDESLVIQGEPANRSVRGFGFGARLANTFTLSTSANGEFGISGLTGVRPFPIRERPVGDVNALNARQNLFGVDFTLRWKATEPSVNKSFMLQGEVLRQTNPFTRGEAFEPCTGNCIAFVNTRAALLEIPVDTVTVAASSNTGAYIFARWQFSGSGYVGGRYDTLQDPGFSNKRTNAASAYVEMYAGKVAKVNAMAERVNLPARSNGVTRFIVQAVFALGPHQLQTQ